MKKLEKRALRSPFLIVNPKAYIYGQESLIWHWSVRD